MIRLANLPAWPHRLSIKKAALVAAIACTSQLGLLLGGAYLDGTLYLPGDGVGLLHHPGIFSVVLGDFILFVLCAKCTQLTMRVGTRLPNDNRRLVLRYVRSRLIRKTFSENGYFIRLFAFLFIIGFLALINQTIKLFNPVFFYWHDTFDSIWHPYSFAANRINLFLSWCIVLPLFAAYLIAHIFITNRSVRAARRHGLLTFHVRHPDKSGGYSYFGYMNTLYMLGLVVILAETFLLIYTHAKIDLSNILPLFVIGAGYVFISYFSVYEVSKAIKKIEIEMKNRGYVNRYALGQALDLYYFAMVYHINFSAYNYLTARLILFLRIVSFVPAIYKIAQYSWQLAK